MHFITYFFIISVYENKKAHERRPKIEEASKKTKQSYPRQILSGHQRTCPPTFRNTRPYKKMELEVPQQGLTSASIPIQLVPHLDSRKKGVCGNERRRHRSAVPLPRRNPRGLLWPSRRPFPSGRRSFTFDLRRDCFRVHRRVRRHHHLDLDMA